MINKVILLGRLTRDPELRNTQSGTAITSFSLAVDRNAKDADGNRQADFISCVAWQKTAEILAQYVRKGTLIAVAGRLQSRRYVDNDANRIVMEVVVEEFSFCERRQDTAPALVPAPAYTLPMTAKQAALPFEVIDTAAYDDGSGLPF